MLSQFRFYISFPLPALLTYSFLELPSIQVFLLPLQTDHNPHFSPMPRALITVCCCPFCALHAPVCPFPFRNHRKSLKAQAIWSAAFLVAAILPPDSPAGIAPQSAAICILVLRHLLCHHGSEIRISVDMRCHILGTILPTRQTGERRSHLHCIVFFICILLLKRQHLLGICREALAK